MRATAGSGTQPARKSREFSSSLPCQSEQMLVTGAWPPHLVNLPDWGGKEAGVRKVHNTECCANRAAVWMQDLRAIIRDWNSGNERK